MKKNYIISIDMGGTKILAAILNSSEGIIANVKKATKNGSSKNEYVKALVEVIDEVISVSRLRRENIKAVCLGIPGSVNPYTGKVGLAPNLGLKNFYIKDQLEKLISLPVLIENDVNLGALGIKKFGVAKDVNNVLTVFIGTGIGGALIFEGKLYRGANYVAGEIGHMAVVNKGPLCGCGNHGCFEAVASRTAIVNYIKADIKAGRKSIITKLVKPNQRIKSKAIASAVKSGDKIVINRITQACDTIGVVLANLTNLLNFNMIVLGGGLTEAVGKFMLPIIKKSYKSNVLKDADKELNIVLSKLGDDAALYGGIALAEEFLNIKV